MSDLHSELQARVRAYEQVWNLHDATSVALFFTDDADMVIGNGPRIVGRDAIEEAWDTYFAHIKESRKGTFDVDSIRIIAPDVALVNVNSTTAGRDPGGEELPTRLARGTWILVRHAGEWRIAALRALPAEGEVRVTPGTDR